MTLRSDLERTDLTPRAERADRFPIHADFDATGVPHAYQGFFDEFDLTGFVLRKQLLKKLFTVGNGVDPDRFARPNFGMPGARGHGRQLHLGRLTRDNYGV